MNSPDILTFLKSFVFPNIGKIILNIALFELVALLLCVFVLVFMTKKQMFTRDNKVYNVIVKLIYIPGIIILLFAVFAQIGFVRGVYKLISKQEKTIVSEVYNQSVKYIFETPEQKNLFISNVKAKIDVTNDIEKSIMDNISQSSLNTENKSKIYEFISKKYHQQVTQAILYGLCTYAKIRTDKKLSYNDFENLSNKIQEASPAEVEKNLTLVLSSQFHRFLKSQYFSIIISIFITTTLLLLIPFIEFWIYKYFMKRKNEKK